MSINMDQVYGGINFETKLAFTDNRGEVCDVLCSVTTLWVVIEI